MGFRLSSFLAGASKGAANVLEEDEAAAAKSASFGVKALKENYDKVQAENRKLETEVSENIKTLRTFDNSATEAELFAAATNKAYMAMALDAAKSNPASFKVGDVVKIKEDNPSTQTAMERLKIYTSLPAVSKSARQAEESSGNFIADLRSKVASRAGSKAEEQTAKAMGVSIEKLRAASDFKRDEIDTGAEFDFTSMQKQPSNAKEITDALEVSEIQAAQKFGKNSPEAVKAKEKLEFVKSFETQADKNQDARAERLMLERLNTKDPARIAEIDADLKVIRASIINHKKLTTIKDPKEKEATYNAMKTDVSDFVNTRMRDAKGTKWREMVTFKTYTDEGTGKTITSKSTKVDMTPEQQQEMFAFERGLTAQALKANGYVLQDGTPRTPVAERLMRNFNISAADLSTAPDAQAAPPKVAPTPAAQPVKPATAPTPPQLTRQDQEALVWANTPANAGPQADAIKKKIQNKIDGVK